MKWLLFNINFALAETDYPKFLINNFRSTKLIEDSLKKTSYHFVTSNDQKYFFYGKINAYKIFFQFPLILGIELRNTNSIWKITNLDQWNKKFC